MKALIVTVMYVLGAFVGDSINYGTDEALMMVEYNALPAFGLTLALFLAGVIPGRDRMTAAMWACWLWFYGAMMAGATCPRCGGYRTVNRDDKCFCRSCGAKF